MQVGQEGIACDKCGSKYSNNFVYYSFDFRIVQVNNNIRPDVLSILSYPVVASFDICQKCYAEISQIVVQNYQKSMSHKRKPQTTQVCEMSGNILSGTYIYYHCNVVEANVNLEGQPYICGSCQKVVDDINRACVCGGDKFIRVASVNTDDRHLEIIMSEPEFLKFRQQVERFRSAIAQWSTQS